MDQAAEEQNPVFYLNYMKRIYYKIHGRIKKIDKKRTARFKERMKEVDLLLSKNNQALTSRGARINQTINLSEAMALLEEMELDLMDLFHEADLLPKTKQKKDPYRYIEDFG
jgi:hypothetical protein